MPCKVAIVGASSLVGREILKTLSERSFPLSNIRLFETEHSVGQYLSYQNSDVLIEEITEHVLREEKFRIVFFAGGKTLTQQYMNFAKEVGSFVIDASFYSNNNANAPLVVPKINSELIKQNAVVANPCCLTVQLAKAFAPILKKSNIERTVISTYQSVSGAGFFGVEELERQIVEIEDGKEASLHYFSKQIAFNVIPQVNDFEGDWTKEELQLEQELNEIFGEKSFDVSVTCVRVPVIRGHSASVMVELSEDISVDDIYYLWEEAGLETYREVDDYPTPWDVEGLEQIGVARLRDDRHKKRCYHFWIVSDNLLVGMALNSVHIAEEYLDINK